MAPGHPFEQLNAVRIKDLHEQNYLARANCEYNDYLRAIREKIGGVDLKRPYTSERDDWIQCMVLAGLGFTYIPEYAVTVPGLVIRPLVEPEVFRTVSLVTVRGRPHSPAVGAFVREAKRYDWANASQPRYDTRLRDRDKPASGAERRSLRVGLTAKACAGCESRADAADPRPRPATPLGARPSCSPAARKLSDSDLMLRDRLGGRARKAGPCRRAAA